MAQIFLAPHPWHHVSPFHSCVYSYLQSPPAKQSQAQGKLSKQLNQESGKLYISGCPVLSQASAKPISLCAPKYEAWGC